jgi:hypothetical protein
MKRRWVDMCWQRARDEAIMGGHVLQDVRNEESKGHMLCAKCAERTQELSMDRLCVH